MHVLRMYLARAHFRCRTAELPSRCFTFLSASLYAAHANPNNDIVIRATCRVSGMSDLVLNYTPRVVVPSRETWTVLRVLVTIAEAQIVVVPANFRSRQGWTGVFLRISIRLACPKAPPISISTTQFRGITENRRNPGESNPSQRALVVIMQYVIISAFCGRACRAITYVRNLFSPL